MLRAKMAGVRPSEFALSAEEKVDEGTYASHKKKPYSNMTEGTYASHKQQMRKNRMLHTYDIAKNLKYRKAWQVIEQHHLRVYKSRDEDVPLQFLKRNTQLLKRSRELEESGKDGGDKKGGDIKGGKKASDGKGGKGAKSTTEDTVTGNTGLAKDTGLGSALRQTRRPSQKEKIANLKRQRKEENKKKRDIKAQKNKLKEN